MIRILSIILIAQIALAVFVNMGGDSLGAFKSEEKLLSLALADLDKISIEQPEKDPLILEKKNDTWQIPSYFNAPVAKKKLEDFAKNLFKNNKSYPVSKTKIAAKKLKLSKDDFERRLTFFSSGAEKAKLYLGTSPSFKKAHARLDGDDQSYSIEFGSYEADPKASNWFDKDLLKLEQNKISRVVFKDFQFVRDGEELKVEGLAEGEETDSVKVIELVGSAVYIKVQEILGTEKKEEFNADAPEITFSLEHQDKGEITYNLSKPKEGSHYILKVSTLPYYFKVGKNIYDQFAGKTKDQYLKAAQPAVETTVEEVSQDTEASAPAASKVETKTEVVEEAKN